VSSNKDKIKKRDEPVELCVLRQEEDPMQTVSLCRLCCNSLKLSWTKIWKTENGGKMVSAIAGRPKLLFE